MNRVLSTSLSLCSVLIVLFYVWIAALLFLILRMWIDKHTVIVCEGWKSSNKAVSRYIVCGFSFECFSNRSLLSDRGRRSDWRYWEPIHDHYDWYSLRWWVLKRNRFDLYKPTIVGLFERVSVSLLESRASEAHEQWFPILWRWVHHNREHYEEDEGLLFGYSSALSIIVFFVFFDEL